MEKNTSTLKIQVNDWHSLHSGFSLALSPGYTPLVGPNGAGKTTLLQQLREYAGANGIDVWSYSNLTDGGNDARERYLSSGNISMFVTATFSSEGEQVAMNFAGIVTEMGARVSKAINSDTPLFVLLDAIDSGASIDRTRETRNFLELVDRDIKDHNAKVYVVAAVNQYELVAERWGINARVGEKVEFASYSEYADFICGFEKQFPRKDTNASEKRKRQTSMKNEHTACRAKRGRVITAAWKQGFRHSRDVNETQR